MKTMKNDKGDLLLFAQYRSGSKILQPVILATSSGGWFNAAVRQDRSVFEG